MNYKSILEGQVRDLQKIQDQLINEGDVKSPQITEVSKQILEIVKYLDSVEVNDSVGKNEILEELIKLRKTVVAIHCPDCVEVFPEV